MKTKLDRLQTTVIGAEKWWVSRVYPHQNHESTWSLQVVEPILTALDWPRLRKAEIHGTGAFYEWPDKHNVDIALLENGKPAGFSELKKDRGGSVSHLRRQMEEWQELQGVRVAVASWWRPRPGFVALDVGEGGRLDERTPVTLAEAAKDASPLAQLAAPVILNGTAPQQWLASVEAMDGPVNARFDTRDIQNRFFARLRAKLEMDRPPEPRRACRCKAGTPPTPSVAYIDLPGILPATGLAFHIDTTMNWLQCFFYCDCNTQDDDDRIGERSFDESGLDDAFLERFLDQSVLPEIRRRRANSGG